MKLPEWARKNGISYRTALRWYHDGRLPARAEQLDTGTILVYEEAAPASPRGEVIIYARASSHDQRSDLERQVVRGKDFAAARGLRAKAVVEEIGAGLNGRRAKLIRLLADPAVVAILVEHRDRLSRFGVECVEAALVSQSRSIIVADETEEMADIWHDFIDAVTPMCARIYGRRGARNRAKKAVEAVGDLEG